MSKQTTLKWIYWTIVIVVVGGFGFFGYQSWEASRLALPKGISSGNGRVEAELVQIATKEPLRVKEIRVDQGAAVHLGEVLVVMDTTTLEAQKQETEQNVAAIREQEAIIKATIARSKALIELAKIEVDRSKNLVGRRAGSQRELDLRRTALQTASASLQEEEAKLRTIEQDVKVAQAKVAEIQTRVNDATLKSPIEGRVLYRLVEVGDVLAAGGKALTLVDLADAHLEIYVPSDEAAFLKIGAEARVVMDYCPAVALPAYVSFVSPQAEFTPGHVDRPIEQERLALRVKLRVPKEIVESNIEMVKTGLGAVGYVRANESVQWPKWLQNLLTSPKELSQMGPPCNNAPKQ